MDTQSTVWLTVSAKLDELRDGAIESLSYPGVDERKSDFCRGIISAANEIARLAE